MQGSQGPEPFGDYVLLERIAVGGMAELFRAELMNGEQFETPICIKRILPHYSDDENFVNMFIDEATIAAQLAHPNIVKIYEFNAYDGSYFIAMELVDGKDLKQTLELAYRKQTRLTAPMIAYIARDVVSALHYAHARRVDGKPLGIIHRDVSPHNVLLGFNGDVKLTDFGIAKAASRLTHTRAGTVKGKCAYMSPEQARGKTLDGRSDLFSVGILIHEMLTGRRLFTGESDFEILSKVIRDPIPRPSDIVPDVDPELEQICIRTLERDRDRRWRDGMEMEEALTNWMRARGVDHTNTGLDRFVQSVFGRANHPLPTPGVSSTPHSKQDEMALAAAMPTAMLTPGMLPEESPSNNSAPPSDDPNMQRTMALDMPPSPSGPPPTAQNSDDRTAIFDLDSAPSDLGLGGYDDPSPPPPQPATDYGSDSQKHERTAVFNALDHDLGPPPGHPARPPSPPPTNWFNIALIGAIFGVLGLTLCVIAVGAIMLEPDLLGESKPAVASSKGKKNKGKKSKGRKSKTRKTSPKKGSEDSAQAKTKDDSKKSDSAAAQAKKTPTPNDKTTSKDD
ncbi:MAG: serine/threonine-protein kinase, partial [Myxococcota bacterium]